MATYIVILPRMAGQYSLKSVPLLFENGSAQYKREQYQYQKDIENYFGHSGRACGYIGKSEYCCHYSYYKKYRCPSKHNKRFCLSN